MVRAAEDINPQYRARVNAMFETAIEQYGDSPLAREAAVIGRDVHGELMQAMMDGDQEAVAMIGWFSRLGLVRDANRYMRSQDHGTVEFHNGAVKIRRMPGKFALRVTEDDQLVITKGHQLLLWWTMTWPQFNRMVRQLQRQHGTLSERITIFTRKVLPLRRKYPESVTPEQACRLEGIDPRHLVMDVHDRASA